MRPCDSALKLSAPALSRHAPIAPIGPGGTPFGVQHVEPQMSALFEMHFCWFPMLQLS